MNLARLYNKACCVMQWNIGFCRGDIEQIIRDKRNNLSFEWMPLEGIDKSKADPFVFRDPAGQLNLLYEDFSMVDPNKYGTIALTTLDEDFIPLKITEVLDAKSHSSYPFVFVENGKTFVIPETSFQRKVSVYEYDFVSKKLVNEQVIIPDIPLLDSTIVKHNGRYWLFGTLSNSNFSVGPLLIYYADTLLGPYKQHVQNPIKQNLDGSRPAGNIIKVDGNLYRPTQNGNKHYGESISINKINILSEDRFEEEFHFKITPDKNSAFNSGLHTINVIDNIIVVDGIKMLFRPIMKWKLFLQKKLKNKHFISS